MPRADKADLTMADGSCKHCHGLGYWTQIIPQIIPGRLKQMGPGVEAREPDVRRKCICKCVRKAYEKRHAAWEKSIDESKAAGLIPQDWQR
jgi:hypothetical protein